MTDMPKNTTPTEIYLHHRNQILLEVETMINNMRLAEPTDVEPEARLFVRSTYADILDAVVQMGEGTAERQVARRLEEK